MFLFEPNSRLGKIEAPDHPLLTTPGPVGSLVGAMMYDTIGPVGPPWRVLATDQDGRPAIVEATVGRGIVVVIEPSIDRYAAAGGDEPDEAVSTTAAQAFLRNLVAYLGGE